MLNTCQLTKLVNDNFSLLKNGIVTPWVPRHNNFELIKDALVVFLQNSLFYRVTIVFGDHHFHHPFFAFDQTTEVMFKIISSYNSHMLDDSPVAFLQFIKDTFKNDLGITIDTPL